MKCESKTTKRAWRNPLAPMAQCSREARVTMTSPGGSLMRVCGVHAARLRSFGWTNVVKHLESKP